MKIAYIGKDYLTIDEKNVVSIAENNTEKIHLIKLNFTDPTKEKILSVVNVFSKTNRYVICNNIRIYNDVLKYTGKKYYIENIPGSNFISYLRKNNKILLNFSNLREIERTFLLNTTIMEDILKNVEVIQVSKSIYNANINVFNIWDGNIIIEEV